MRQSKLEEKYFGAEQDGGQHKNGFRPRQITFSRSVKRMKAFLVDKLIAGQMRENTQKAKLAIAISYIVQYSYLDSLIAVAFSPYNF